MKEIKKIYAAHFLAGLATASSVVFTLYLLSYNITQFQIAQLFAFFMIALALFEVPTGGFADTFGHKASVVIGIFFQSVSFLFWFAFPVYWGFFVGMFFSALGLSFQSGAMSSLVYELVKQANMHQDFQKIYGRANSYFLIAGIVAAPFGSLIYALYPRVPYVFSFLVMLFAAITISLVKWKFVKKSYSFSKYTETIIQGVKLTIRHRVLMAIVIIGIALTTNRMLMNQNISQPYMVSIGLDVSYIGFISAVLSAILALVYLYTHKLSQKIGKTKSLIITVLVPSITVLSLGFVNNLFIALPIMFLVAIGHTFRDPVFTSITHDEVEPDKRSTMASTISFLTCFAGLSLPIFGVAIDVFGIRTTLFILGAFTFIVGGAGILLFKSKRHFNNV